MLHIVRHHGIANEDNQKEFRRLSKTYPDEEIVLSQIAQSFNYRNAKKRSSELADLDNVVQDTSAVCESAALSTVLETLGPKEFF